VFVGDPYHLVVQANIVCLTLIVRLLRRPPHRGRARCRRRGIPRHPGRSRHPRRAASHRPARPGPCRGRRRSDQGRRPIRAAAWPAPTCIAGDADPADARRAIRIIQDPQVRQDVRRSCSCGRRRRRPPDRRLSAGSASVAATAVRHRQPDVSRARFHVATVDNRSMSSPCSTTKTSLRRRRIAYSVAASRSEKPAT